MKNKVLSENMLSRRERQIMDILYSEKEVSVLQVQEAMNNEISYSSVRSFLSILEKKGFITHREAEGKYLYSPAGKIQNAVEHSIGRLLSTFFNGSVEEAVCTLIDMKKESLSDEAYKRIKSKIDQIKKERNVHD
jgi:BlaI family transcriptional regulator, penicillinase repressor